MSDTLRWTSHTNLHGKLRFLKYGASCLHVAEVTCVQAPYILAGNAITLSTLKILQQQGT